jgi:hypothetical protein
LTDEQARRVGLNETLFREVNEQIRRLTDDFGTDEGTITIICECGDAVCTERLDLALSEYERVRADGRTYAIAKGHAFPDAERVVASTDSYEVVRKREGAPAELARETDPRA